MKGHEFSQQLRLGAYAWPGGYPRFLVLKLGDCLCFCCAKANHAQIRLDAMTGARAAPLGFDVNWEDPALFCDDCGERIESAYAEPKEK